MKTSQALMMLLLLCMTAAYSQARPMDVPVHFQPQLQQWDDEGYDRVYGLEEATVYRVYEKTPGVLTIILSVEAYEEPMLVLVTLDETRVQAVEILYENETDDYGGDYVVKGWFLDRLLLKTAKPLETVVRKKSNDHEVIAITGATITSMSVVMAVNKSIEIREAYENENE